MRAVVVLLAATQICWRASAASAETQVKAEDCSSAVSGTVIGSHIEIHCLSKEDIEQVVDELVRQGVVKRAEDAGIETSVIVSLAARLNPRQKFDFAQAVVEVSSAVDIAIKIAKEGASGSSDQLVDEVVKRIAEKTKDNDAAGATREAEEGFARWEKQEAERRTNATATGVALLEAALKTDLLRFDAGTAAGRVEKISLLQHEGDSTARLGVIRTWFAQFYVEGMDKGVNFSLEVAIAIARREIALAEGPDQHGAALGDLGLALTTLGGRENGTARLKEAIETHRAALQELSRESTPFDWAKEQNNLGNALSQLGDRESGTERYEEAIRAYRQALAASTREQAPLDWGLMENNLGAILYKVGKYDDAVAADRAAMEEWTRERVPLQWAMAQTNLALALAALGTKGGTAKLEEAVAAYRLALEELTRQRVPMRWAQTMTGLGIVLQLLGLIPKAPLVDSRGGFPNRGRADSSWRGRFAPCHQRSDCERTIRLRRFGRSPGVRRTLTRAGGFCRWLRSWTAWTGARRRRSAGWIARRCVTGSIASTGRVWRASSTTGRRVPSLVFRRSNWLSSRRSSRRVRIVRRTGSCAGVGSTSNASSPRGSVSTFIRAMSESSSRNWASPTSVRGPVIQLKTSGPSRLSKTYGPPRLQGVLSRLAADPVCINVSGLEELPPAMMEIRTLRSS